MINTIINGNTLEVLRTMPNDYVDCVVTSPPYYQLRDYGNDNTFVWDGDENCSHLWEGDICQKCIAWRGQLGLEPIYQMFVQHLLQITAELKRVLKPQGTMWINIADSYSKANSSQVNQTKWANADITLNRTIQSVVSKSLLLVPHRYAMACIDELGLVLRNTIIWQKPNGMPESVTDRFSKKHEYLFFFAKQQNYYFDLDSVKCTANPQAWNAGKNFDYKAITSKYDELGKNKFIQNGNSIKEKIVARNRERILAGEEIGKNPGDVAEYWAEGDTWNITTKPSSIKHFATFNTELIEKPIVAGCPEGGVVLDPFCGTGTTGVRALKLGRKFIGIDGNKEYCDIAQTNISNYINQLF